MLEPEIVAEDGDPGLDNVDDGFGTRLDGLARASMPRVGSFAETRAESQRRLPTWRQIRSACQSEMRFAELWRIGISG